MIQCANVFDKHFICRVIYIFTFYGNFARFSYVIGWPRDVEEIMQITYPAFDKGMFARSLTGTVVYRHNLIATGRVG